MGKKKEGEEEEEASSPVALFRSDIALIVANCQMYNAKDSPIYTAASDLASRFTQLSQRFLGTRAPRWSAIRSTCDDLIREGFPVEWRRWMRERRGNGVVAALMVLSEKTREEVAHWARERGVGEDGLSGGMLSDQGKKKKMMKENSSNGAVEDEELLQDQGLEGNDVK